MKAMEFVEKIVDGVNKRVGDEIHARLKSDDDLPELARELLNREVDMTRAGACLQAAFDHIRNDHEIPVKVRSPKADAPPEVWAQKIVAGVSAGYAPEAPNPADWKNDEKLRHALHCATNFFCELMLVDVDPKVIRNAFQSVHAESKRKQEERRGNEERKYAASLQAVAQTTGEAVFVPKEAFRGILIALDAIRWMKEPKILLALADAVRAIPNVRAQKEFYERFTFALGKMDNAPDEDELAVLLAGAQAASNNMAN